MRLLLYSDKRPRRSRHRFAKFGCPSLFIHIETTTFRLELEIIGHSILMLLKYEYEHRFC